MAPASMSSAPTVTPFRKPRGAFLKAICPNLLSEEEAPPKGNLSHRDAPRLLEQSGARHPRKDLSNAHP
jgi:hypothetical protein